MDLVQVSNVIPYQVDFLYISRPLNTGHVSQVGVLPQLACGPKLGIRPSLTFSPRPADHFIKLEPTPIYNQLLQNRFPVAMSTTTILTQTVTAENVVRLFPDVNTNLAGSHRVSVNDRDLAGYDEEQIRLMEEVCIVLDEDDVPIGSASKKVCTCSGRASRT